MKFRRTDKQRLAFLELLLEPKTLAKHLSIKENCLCIKSRRKAMIRRSRLLFSSPPKFKPNNVSDLEKLQLQKVTRSSLDPADEHAKKDNTVKHRS